MTFWVTRDALVHVCMDSRTPPGKLPSWLEYAGFRKIPVRLFLFGAGCSLASVPVVHVHSGLIGSEVSISQK